MGVGVGVWGVGAGSIRDWTCDLEGHGADSLSLVLRCFHFLCVRSVSLALSCFLLQNNALKSPSKQCFELLQNNVLKVYIPCFKVMVCVL